MDIEYYLMRLRIIDGGLRLIYQMRISESPFFMIVDENMLIDEKNRIISTLDQLGFIAKEEMNKYYLAKDMTFTPRIEKSNTIDKFIIKEYPSREWQVAEIFKNEVKIADVNKYYEITSDFIIIYETIGGSGPGFQKGGVTDKIYIGEAELRKEICE